jgi:hypothetical protein
MGDDAAVATFAGARLLAAANCSDMTCLSESLRLLAESVAVLQAAVGVDGVDNETGSNATGDPSLLVVWSLTTGFSIMFMQTGFALVEAGTARATSVKTVLLKNLMDFGICIILWWLFGYAISTVNLGAIALSQRSGMHLFSPWFSSLGFCSSAVAIVSGGILGRMDIFGCVPHAGYTLQGIPPRLLLFLCVAAAALWTN